MGEGERVALQDGCWQRSVTALTLSWLRPDLIEKEIEARIGIFEAAAAARAATGQEVPKVVASEMEREIVERRERWLARWSGALRDHDMTERVNMMRVVDDPDSGILVTLWLPFLFFYYGVKRVLGFGTTSRLMRAMHSYACPDCGYLLVTSEFSGSRRLRLIGPRWCTECGSIWPLVPPPRGGTPR